MSSCASVFSPRHTTTAPPLPFPLLGRYATRTTTRRFQFEIAEMERTNGSNATTASAEAEASFDGTGVWLFQKNLYENGELCVTTRDRGFGGKCKGGLHVSCPHIT